MKALQEIVTAEVKRHYSTENKFYENVLGIKQQSWNRWKNGEQEFREKHLFHIRGLFTDYEWMLVNKIATQMNMYPNNFKKEPFEQYIDTKKVIAKKWVEKATISVNSARNVDDSNDGKVSPGTKVEVTASHGDWIDDSLTFYTNQSSGHIPSGKRNRIDWFDKNIEGLK